MNKDTKAETKKALENKNIFGFTIEELRQKGFTQDEIDHLFYMTSISSMSDEELIDETTYLMSSHYVYGPKNKTLYSRKHFSLTNELAERLQQKIDDAKLD